LRLRQKKKFKGNFSLSPPPLKGKKMGVNAQKREKGKKGRKGFDPNGAENGKTTLQDPRLRGR